MVVSVFATVSVVTSRYSRTHPYSTHYPTTTMLSSWNDLGINDVVFEFHIQYYDLGLSSVVEQCTHSITTDILSCLH